MKKKTDQPETGPAGKAYKPRQADKTYKTRQADKSINPRKAEKPFSARQADKTHKPKRDSGAFAPRQADGADRRGAGDTGDDLIVGRNSVIEAVKAERPLNKVFVQKDGGDSRLQAVAAYAKGAGVPVAPVEKAWLDKLAGRGHQGVAAFAAAKEYNDISDILNCAKARGEQTLILVAGGIQDPNNLGAVIRCAEAAGAHGVVIQRRNATGLTGAVARTSAGAIEHIMIARAANLTEALRYFKKNGVWTFAADASGGTPYTECDFSAASAIVIGGEGDGLGRLAKETCDFTVSLPMRGKTASLNASAAAAILLYEALRQRGGR